MSAPDFLIYAVLFFAVAFIAAFAGCAFRKAAMVTELSALVARTAAIVAELQANEEPE